MLADPARSATPGRGGGGKFDHGLFIWKSIQPPEAWHAPTMLKGAAIGHGRIGRRAEPRGAWGRACNVSVASAVETAAPGLRALPLAVTSPFLRDHVRLARFRTSATQMKKPWKLTNSRHFQVAGAPGLPKLPFLPEIRWSGSSVG